MKFYMIIPARLVTAFSECKQQRKKRYVPVFNCIALAQCMQTAMISGQVLPRNCMGGAIDIAKSAVQRSSCS